MPCDEEEGEKHGRGRENTEKAATGTQTPSRAAESFISLQHSLLTVSNDVLSFNVRTYCMLYVLALENSI